MLRLINRVDYKLVATTFQHNVPEDMLCNLHLTSMFCIKIHSFKKKKILALIVISRIPNVYPFQNMPHYRCRQYMRPYE